VRVEAMGSWRTPISRQFIESRGTRPSAVRQVPRPIDLVDVDLSFCPNSARLVTGRSFVKAREKMLLRTMMWARL